MPHLPSPAAIRAFLSTHRLTGDEAARAGYLRDDAAVRKHYTGKAPSRLHPAVWFAWHAHQLLPRALIDQIEAAMDESARAPDRCNNSEEKP